MELRSAALPAALPVRPADAATDATARAAGVAAQAGDVAGAATVDTGMQFTLAAVTCRPPAQQGPVLVVLRTSEDGLSWSRWYEVSLERAAENGGEEKAFTEPIWTGTGRYLQVAARPAGGEATPALLRDVRVVAINSTEDADTASALVGVARRAAAAVAGIDLTAPADRDDHQAQDRHARAVGRQRVLALGFSRLRPGQDGVRPPHGQRQRLHRPRRPRPSCAAIYAYHTKSLHWSDIGYNFLIDRYGTIYEGRYGGVSRGVIGAQVLGFNTGSTGISLIGTFTNATPPSGALTALERLLEWKLDVHHVDALGTGTLVCGYGQKFGTGQHVKFPAIAGHRDANYTDCPGGRVYSQLPNIRKVVARTGQPKIYGFIAGDPSISPNGDGVNDKVTIGFTVSQQAAWTVEIRSDSGMLVRHMTGEGTVVEETWGGRDDNGDALPDGVYSLQADATSAAGEARSATANVRLDTVPPKVESSGADPDPFSPNADGQDDATSITYTPSEAVQARLSVVDAAGDVLRRVTGWKSVTAGAHKVTWDGRVGAGADVAPAPEGTATLLLEARDAAGNPAALRRKVAVDRTLKLSGVSRKTFSPNGDGVHDDVTLSFKLTRAADVVATVTRGGSTLRTFKLGRLGAGARSVTWDGKLGGGGTATSGAYTIKVTADGALGVTSAAQPVTVDLAAPRVTAPLTVRVAYRRTAKIPYTVKDAFSPSVKVGATVTNANGKVIATLALGWVKQGAAQTCAWKPRRRGTYTVTFRAMDLGGNKLAARVATTVKVR